MAHLLGSRFCLESLHDDVADLQSVVVDVVSRTGPVTQPSWKYPDKAASDVNVAHLLDMYVYTDDEEERQVAHIVLLELVIDRLVLLLQAMAKFIELTLAVSRANSAVNMTAKSTSIGLVVKKYWNYMVHLNTVTQQLQSESKSKNRKLQELEETTEQLTTALEAVQSCSQDEAAGGAAGGSLLSGGVNPGALLPGGMDPATLANLLGKSSRRAKSAPISRDECNKASQTVETAFVPCDACASVQACLRQAGSAVVKLMNGQGINSALERHMGYVRDIQWMTHRDISRWTGEQTKDFGRLDTHLRELLAELEPLREQLSKEEGKNEQLNKRVSSLQKELALERQTQSIQMSQYQTKVQAAADQKQVEVDAAKRQLENQATAMQKLQERLDTVTHELQQTKAALKDAETSQEDLQKKVEQMQKDSPEIRRLQAELQELECQLDKSRGRLSEVNRELTKEKARAKSVNKHSESLQGKQGSLLQRIDALDVENEDLRGQVTDLHDDMERIKAALQRSRDELRETEGKLRNAEDSCQRLEEQKRKDKQSLQVATDKVSNLEKELNEAHEAQRLIVEYPDLNGPVNKDLVGSGDIAADMENQVRANSVRIKVLEDQNAGLRNTITRMLQVQAVSRTPATQLWKQTDSQVNTAEVIHDEGSDVESDPGVSHPPTFVPPHSSNDGRQSRLSQGNGSTTHHVDHNDRLFYKRPTNKPPQPASASHKGKSAVDWVPPETFTVKKAPRPQGYSKGTKARPTSAKPAAAGAAKANTPSTSSISAYLQLKRAGMIKSAEPTGRTRPVSAVSKAPSDGYSRDSMVTCEKCDKIYSHKKDLEIHRNYCFGAS